ncbi:Histone acetyltransferase type B subunit 2 [Mycena sanguinolenta]|uniref:Histone acetyltransferase type B subunit 2 n=1 Tax=Mycena sanguinolenta TaxID=230812 RepID=A0A8H7CHG5_9AGAR|nr:Histone acetyltransferase type B subunit 2 [Mycena sanguinolenta]
MRPQVEEIEDDLAAEEENKLINEVGCQVFSGLFTQFTSLPLVDLQEYKTWKKNAPYLYDIVITHALDWPSLTCQWFPDKESSASKPYTTHRLLLGTHTSGQAQDYLQIASVQIPKRTNASGAEKLDRSDYDDERGELGGHTIPPAPRIQITQKINHEGEVNRARYMPQNPDLIATKAVTGEVLVFDRTKHSSEPERGGVCKPDIRLVGQTREGYGLAWSPVKAGNVLGASEDTTVCHWDVNSYTKAKTSIEPTNVFRGHTSVVGDVDWHPTKENVFASVGDDKMLMMSGCIHLLVFVKLTRLFISSWDTRAPTEASTKIQAHDREILAVSFNPACEHLLVTGSADKTVILHDIRAPAKALHTFESHTDEVLHLSWSPHNASVFASASSDRRINIWDLSLIGVEQTPDDQEDGPPELLFVHGENWTTTSTSEDNIVMVWQPTMRVWAGDAVKIDEKELEADAMEGVEATPSAMDKGKGKTSESGGSLSMSVSATSVSGDD